MPKLAGYYYLSQKTQTPSCYFSILCPTLAGAYLAKLTLSFLGVNLVLESTYIGNHLTQVAPKSDMSFCSFALGSQPFVTILLVLILVLIPVVLRTLRKSIANNLYTC